MSREVALWPLRVLGLVPISSSCVYVGFEIPRYKVVDWDGDLSSGITFEVQEQQLGWTIMVG